ncbi:hypothetical protein [Paraburkholderia dilworthii]|uniref:Uncharacterized protein n=1 Tax=Paraburkholderia dilworthii TaxID=948106 RepID=A0ABW9DK29_9BURK
MVTSEGSRATWFKSFKILLRGRSKIIGRYSGLKSVILNFAIFGPIAVFLVQGKQLLLSSGDLPPKAVVIRATGTFVQMTRGQTSWVAFVTEDKRVYNMERGTSISGSRNLPQGVPPPMVYAEGILLENGKGYFWPTLIKLPDGQLQTTPEQSIALLMQLRRRNMGLFVAELLFFTVFWIISFLNVAKINRKLAQGE